jgi:hypothetical protein
MHKDFHLYGTYLAARLAGFDSLDARDIACAAQAVDDFTYGEYGSCDNNADMFVTVRENAKNIIQTLWTTFHFLPELDKAETPAQRFRTAPRGAFFNRLSVDLQATFRTTGLLPGFNLARAGVTMHVLADTYAHEGFSGLISDTNTVKNVLSNMDGEKGIDLGVFIGAFHLPTWAGSIKDTAKIGHGTAGHFPDISWIDYTYEQDGNLRHKNNPQQFVNAFGKMIEVLNLAKNGVARLDIHELQEGALLRIMEERAKKIKEYSCMWFFAKRITNEERDTVFKNFMLMDYFNLRDGYTPENLEADYKTYIDNVNSFAKEVKDTPGRMDAHHFLNATIWHRINVLPKIWDSFPNFPTIQSE